LRKGAVIGSCFCGKPEIVYAFDTYFCQHHNDELAYRFGQKNEVNIYLITTDTMSNVNQAINNKQKQFEVMQDEMGKAVNANINGKLMTNADFDTTEEKNEWYKIKRGDCVQLIPELENESIGLSVFSPPFAELYTYSSHLEDMGNSKDYKEFLYQFSFLIKELRVGIPDYVMIFRKDGERSNPVTNTSIPVDLWQKYASPVWMDIDYGNTLQGFRNGREENDEDCAAYASVAPDGAA
jgi:hypothetical protein